MTDTDQKTALVTGASRGLGAAIAEALAPEYHVIAVARTQGALEELDDRIKARGGQATLAPMDLSDEGATQHLGRSLFDRWGGVDLWIHTAIHGAPLAPAAHIDGKDFDKSIAGNVTATRLLIQSVEPLLRARAGKAVFFDDESIGDRFFASYGATKTAQMALVRNWQAEGRKTGPEVRILTPNPMSTGLRARFFPGEDRAPLATARDEAMRLLPRITA